MAYNAYDEIVMGHPNIKYYWMFDGNLSGHVGGVAMSGAVTYTSGAAHSQAAGFDGATESLGSMDNIDLTGTDKVTFAFWGRFDAYNTSVAVTVMEHTVNAFAADTKNKFGYFTNGNLASDPVTCGQTGNVGLNYAAFFNSSVADTQFHHIVQSIDLTRGAELELDYYVDSVKQTAISTLAVNNNTGTFSASKFYVGARNHATGWANCSIDGLAIYDAILTQDDINKLYASVSGIMPAVSRQNLDMQPILKMG